MLVGLDGFMFHVHYYYSSPSHIRDSSPQIHKSAPKLQDSSVRPMFVVNGGTYPSFCTHGVITCDTP